MTDPKHCECGARGKCLDSRPNGNYVRRHYKCLKCPKRWTTYEARATDTQMEAK